MNTHPICTGLVLSAILCSTAVVSNLAHAQSTQVSSAAAFAEAVGYYTSRVNGRQIGRRL